MPDLTASPIQQFNPGLGNLSQISAWPGQAAAAQPPAITQGPPQAGPQPQGPTVPPELEPLIRVRMAILGKMFSRIPMPDNVKRQLAMNVQTFSQQLERLKQTALMKNKVELAKKLDEMGVELQKAEAMVTPREKLGGKTITGAESEAKETPAQKELTQAQTVAARALAQRRTEGDTPETTDLKKAQAEAARTLAKLRSHGTLTPMEKLQLDPYLAAIRAAVTPKDANAAIDKYETKFQEIMGERTGATEQGAEDTAAQSELRVRVKATGQTGTIPAGEFDAKIYERIP